MIDFAMTTSIEDVEVHHFPLEIISEILQQVKTITTDPLLTFYLATIESSSICSRKCHRILSTITRKKLSITRNM
jgi:hypothetical protein